MEKESYLYCEVEIAEAIKLAPDLSKLKITLPRGLSEQEQYYYFCDLLAHPGITSRHLEEVAKKSKKGMAVIEDILRHPKRTKKIVSSMVGKIEEIHTINLLLKHNQVSRSDLQLLWDMYKKFTGRDVMNSGMGVESIDTRILFLKQKEFIGDLFWDNRNHSDKDVIEALLDRADLDPAYVRCLNIDLMCTKLSILARNKCFPEEMKDDLLSTAKLINSAFG